MTTVPAPAGSLDDLVGWVSEVLEVPTEHLSSAVLGSHDESVTYRIVDSTTGNAFVAKAFRERKNDDPVENAVAEYEALERYHTATTGAEPIGCPEPIALRLDPEPAILTRFVDGIPVDRYLAEARSARAVAEIARQMVDGLRLYHEAVGEAFGDLHADHVLRSGAAIVFLDPASPTRGLASLRASPEFSRLALDVGYYCYSVAINWRLLVSHPVRWGWSWRLGSDLVAAASRVADGSAAEAREEIRSAAVAYLHLLRELEGTVRSSVLALLGSLAIRRIS
jgi:hypothetical protein